MTEISAMNSGMITTKLQSVLDACPTPAPEELPVHESEASNGSLGELLQILRDEPSLAAIFDGKMQVMPNRAKRVEISDLADWLISRGRETGAGQAVADLQKYLSDTRIPCLSVFGLGGLEIGQCCSLGSGISLRPWNSLTDSSHKRLVSEEFYFPRSGSFLSAVLVQEIMLPKPHVGKEDWQFPEFDMSELHDALLCIGVVGPFAVQFMVLWVEPPQWAPLTPVGYSVPPGEGRYRSDVWTDEHCSAAYTLLQNFRGLPLLDKEALRIPLQRLNMAMRGLSPVDSAIDLGIALEALFLNDERGELTFRLKLRAARHLGKNSNEREFIFQIVGDLYKLRSAAIHTGKIPTHPIKGRSAPELLEEGFRLTAKAIRLCINNGVPDWSKVQLS